MAATKPRVTAARTTDARKGAEGLAMVVIGTPRGYTGQGAVYAVKLPAPALGPKSKLPPAVVPAP